MNTRNRPLVAVEWVDSAFTAGWRVSSDAVPTFSHCKTVGYLVEHSKRQIVIAMNVNDDGGYGDSMAIPRRVVRTVKKVKTQ